MRHPFPARQAPPEHRFKEGSRRPYRDQTVVRLFPEGESAILSAADITEEALVRLKDNKFIDGYIRFKDNGEIDREGIDFLIFLKSLKDGTFALPLQVKGSNKSRRHLKRMINKHLKKHPHVDFAIGILLKKGNAVKWVYWRIYTEILRRTLELVESYEDDIEKTSSRLLVKDSVI